MCLKLQKVSGIVGEISNAFIFLVLIRRLEEFMKFRMTIDHAGATVKAPATIYPIVNF